MLAQDEQIERLLAERDARKTAEHAAKRQKKEEKEWKSKVKTDLRHILCLEAAIRRRRAFILKFDHRNLLARDIPQIQDDERTDLALSLDYDINDVRQEQAEQCQECLERREIQESRLDNARTQLAELKTRYHLSLELQP